MHWIVNGTNAILAPRFHHLRERFENYDYGKRRSESM